MSGEECVERPLFGGAISSAFPLRFEDVSNIREVPDHQEVFADPTRDESLVFELLDLKHDVEDGTSAAWFLQDLATEQDAEVDGTVWSFEADGLHYKNRPAIITTAIGQMVLTTEDLKHGILNSTQPSLFPTTWGRLPEAWPFLKEGREERHKI